MRNLLSLVLAGALASAGQAAEQAKPTSSTSAAPGDKMICKRFTRIGTLAGTYKTCKTKREWDQEQLNIRTAGQSGYCGPRETGGGMSSQSC